jgi:hypothetical protein
VRLKADGDDCRIAGLEPEALLGMIVLAETYRGLFGRRILWTECTGGEHKAGSLHYVGLAADFRTNDLTQEQQMSLFTDGRSDLGGDFDLVNEGDHGHLEFQPKRAME